MKRKMLLGVVLVLAMSMVVAVQFTSAMIVTNSTITLGCTSYDYDFDWVFDRDNTGTGSEAYFIEITDGAGKVLRRHDNTFSVPSSGHDGPNTIAYSAVPDYNPLTYRLVSKAGNGFSEQLVDQATGTCVGLPTYSASGPSAPGRDMVEIPSQAVVGAFVENTALLFSPDANAASDNVMTIGQTLWVLGVDSSGQYYQVLLSGDKYWVPVSSMGPNFDDVWNGTPLPTTVVD
jgi:hypothetical protein